MKDLLIILFVLTYSIFSHATSIALAEILSMKSDSKFPHAELKVTYLRHCSTTFHKAVAKESGKDFGIAILVKSNARACLMHEPAYIEENTKLEIFSMKPFGIFPIENIKDLTQDDLITK